MPMGDPVVVQTSVGYGPALITAGAIILSAGLAAWGVHNSIKIQHRIARMRAALDVILRSEESHFLHSLRETFIEVRDGPGLDCLLKAQTSKEKETRREVQAFLNHHELISISMLQGIIDEKIYKKWMRAPFVNDWNDVRELVAQLRETQRRTMFENFEEIAVKWGGEPCRVSSKDLFLKSESAAESAPS